MDQLPDFVDRETFEAWKKCRKAKKWNPICHKIALRSLFELKEKGYDVNECLEWSAFKNWDGIFPKPDYNIQGKPQSTEKDNNDLIKEMELARIQSQTPESKRARDIALSKLKVVR